MMSTLQAAANMTATVMGVAAFDVRSIWHVMVQSLEYEAAPLPDHQRVRSAPRNYTD
jgi:hypothetical protein